eukprot:Gb_39479 [translate_table: standard]
MHQSLLFFDGASKNNPRQAGVGILILIPNQSCKIMLWEGIGPSLNNVAEAKALHNGLRILIKKNIWQVRIYGDSNIITKQVLNQWRCKNLSMMGVIKEIQCSLKHFVKWEIAHIDRRWNVWADALAKFGAEREGGTSGLIEKPICIKENSMELEVSKDSAKIGGGNLADKIIISWSSRVGC